MGVPVKIITGHGVISLHRRYETPPHHLNPPQLHRNEDKILKIICCLMENSNVPKEAPQI